jgi:uncharacterized protein (TIRG00374 family)
VAVSTYLAVHLLGVIKWRLLMARARAHLRFSDAARCYYRGLFANLFLPSLVGGDLVRVPMALRVSRRTGGVLVGSIADRIVDLLSLLILAAVGAWWTSRSALAVDPAILWIVAGVLLAGAVAFPTILLAAPARRVPRAARRTLVEMQRALRAVGRRPSTIVWALAIAVLLQGALVGINAFLASRLQAEISFEAWLFLWPMAKISAIVPLTQGGIGVREAGLVALAAALGLSTVSALAVGLAFQAIVVLGALAAGGISGLLGQRALVSR